MRKSGEYLIKNEDGKLNNDFHEVTYEQMKPFWDDFAYDLEENKLITRSSYNGKTNFPLPELACGVQLVVWPAEVCRSQACNSD